MQVRTVIDTYWQEWATALAESDPDRPAFRALVSGDAEKLVVDVLTKNRALNEVSLRPTTGPMPHKILEVSVAGESATVKQCVIDDAVKIDRTTHETLDKSVQALLMEQLLTRRDGRWVVVDNQTLERLPEGAQCEGY